MKNSVPGILEDRLSKLKQLEEAYKLLNTLNESGIESGREIDFLNERIDRICAELDSSEDECYSMIDKIQDQKTWVYAKLRYIDGKAINEIASLTDSTFDQVRMRLYRKLSKLKEQPQIEERDDEQFAVGPS